jgi:RNA polymerase sigma factor (sigma-70 family)
VTCGDSLVAVLVARAAAGDQQAWDDLIERYKPLVWSTCAKYRLDLQDIGDVNQTVWLRLVENIGCLREPMALPKWLQTTTRRECLRVLNPGSHRISLGLPPDDQIPADEAADLSQEILAAERDAALRAAFRELPPRYRDLLSMLISDPPSTYQEISAKLGIPVGSIGPMRARGLDQLRRSPHLVGIIDGPGWKASFERVRGGRDD